MIDSLKDGWFDATKAAAQGKLLILDLLDDVIYGSKVSGPYSSKSSRGTGKAQLDNLRSVAWEEVKKLKASTDGLRVAIHGLSSLIRDVGLKSTLQFIVSQVSFLRRKGAILISTINPDTMNPTDLAMIEKSLDGIIELTVKEEKIRFQRYIRVKNSPISSFIQERLLSEIIGPEAGISISSKLGEDFESFRANMRKTRPGVLDILCARSLILSSNEFANLRRLLFEILGYEKGFNLMYQVGIESADAIIKPHLDMFKVDVSSPATSFQKCRKWTIMSSSLCTPPD